MLKIVPALNTSLIQKPFLLAVIRLYMGFEASLSPCLSFVDFGMLQHHVFSAYRFEMHC